MDCKEFYVLNLSVLSLLESRYEDTDFSHASGFSFSSFQDLFFFFKYCLKVSDLSTPQVKGPKRNHECGQLTIARKH